MVTRKTFQKFLWVGCISIFAAPMMVHASNVSTELNSMHVGESRSRMIFSSTSVVLAQTIPGIQIVRDKNTEGVSVELPTHSKQATGKLILSATGDSLNVSYEPNLRPLEISAKSEPLKFTVSAIRRNFFVSELTYRMWHEMTVLEPICPVKIKIGEGVRLTTPEAPQSNEQK